MKGQTIWHSSKEVIINMILRKKMRFVLYSQEYKLTQKTAKFLSEQYGVKKKFCFFNVFI